MPSSTKQATPTPKPHFQQPRLKPLDGRLAQHRRLHHRQQILQPSAVRLRFLRLRHHGVLRGSGRHRGTAVSQGEDNLNAVDPVLELKAEIIGWNLINGGAPAKAIDYGQGYSATVPNTMPTPCYAGDSACGAADGGWYPRGLGNRGVRFVGLGILFCREHWIRRRLAFCRSFSARVTSGCERFDVCEGQAPVR